MPMLSQLAGVGGVGGVGEGGVGEGGVGVGPTAEVGAAVKEAVMVQMFFVSPPSLKQPHVQWVMS